MTEIQTDVATAHLPTTRPLILVTVGSDHHRFDRLVGWVDSWTASHSQEVDCVIQHGPAEPPRHALGVDFLPHPELVRLMAEATAVVVQGGPMSIVETRQAGRLPIVVPRLPHLQEVVDDHQIIFARRWAEEGKLLLAEDEAAVHRALDDVVADPAGGRVEDDPLHAKRIGEAVGRIAEIASELLPSPPGPPRVLMIGGAGRSGSTLLERCLAQVPGITGVGEAVHLWERGLREDQLCGCGRPFSQCPTWGKIGDHAFGGWDQVDAEEAYTDRRQVVRNRHLPALLLVGPRAEWRLRRNRLLRRMNRLYRAVELGEQSRLIVDSSKHPAYAYLLRSAAVQMRCVLVIRDPRGVAHSWSKPVRRPEITGNDRLMPQYSPARVVADWVSYRLMLQGLRLFGVPVMVVHYEDFVVRPRQVVADVLRFSGVEPSVAELAHLTEDAVRLDPHHTVAGNPMRFRSGEIAIRQDEAWRTELPRGPRLMVGLLTAPLRFWDGAHRWAQSRRRAPSGTPPVPASHATRSQHG